MVIDEVRFAPMTSITPNASARQLETFKCNRYTAYLPARNDNELCAEITLCLFIDYGNLKINIRNSFLTKQSDGFMRGIWHWERGAVHEPAPASLEEVQRFLSEIGYEVHKITLLEND